jgi:putative hydrolase of the HAD superfamily
MIRTILFDLDETLYPRQAGIMDEIRRLMLDYLRTHFNLSVGEADELRREYFVAYGTTLRGLQINHQIDPEGFLSHVHDIPLDQYLQPNPQLDAVLAMLPQNKVIFTNASREHAERVLGVLGIRRHFDKIVDVRDVDYESKPQPGAYERICALLRVQPEECVLVEDNIQNLSPAKAIGMTTVLVHPDGLPVDGSADYVIAQVEEIDQVMAQLTAET